MNPGWVTFMHGGLTAITLIAAVLFARAWHRSRDRFYLLFGIAFGFLAVHWLALGVAGPPGIVRVWPYMTRLAAFVMILVAIVDKNRRGAR